MNRERRLQKIVDELAPLIEAVKGLDSAAILRAKNELQLSVEIPQTEEEALEERAKFLGSRVARFRNLARRGSDAAGYDLYDDGCGNVLAALSGLLYDTEYAPEARLGGDTSGLPFFQRPLGQDFKFRKDTKENADTNMALPGQLGHPCYFHVTGMQCLLRRHESSDFDNLMSGVAEFLFLGNRIFYRIPLGLIYKAVEMDELSKRVDVQGVEKLLADAHARGDVIDTRFERGLTIGPAESFGVTVHWPQHSFPRNPFTITMVLRGISFVPV